ncbi:porin family protein [Flavobacterium sp. H122]|uniref:porin family protein n=1 Tax=Flavobacterium sp. H122 TaxID=2529860 RepID=UPI0010AAF261|nr:porin family protein [Flavobacterium sp. H122]
MKKAILMIMFLLSVQYGVNAQIMKLGLKAGVNYANFKSSELQTDALTSYHAGLVVNLKLAEKFSIQPEILYSTQGASYKNVVDEVKAELGYISVPVMVKVGLGKSLSLDLGPQFSWLASKNVDANTDVEELDFGAAGGLSLKLTQKLFLQGRYVLGLSEIGKNADIKNSVGQLSIGYMF